MNQDFDIDCLSDQSDLHINQTLILNMLFIKNFKTFTTFYENCCLYHCQVTDQENVFCFQEMNKAIILKIYFC